MRNDACVIFKSINTSKICIAMVSQLEIRISFIPFSCCVSTPEFDSAVPLPVSPALAL